MKSLKELDRLPGKEYKRKNKRKGGSLSMRNNTKKIDETKDVLTMALSTLVEIDSIIPIPLIKAQALVEEAAKMIKKNKNQTKIKPHD